MLSRLIHLSLFVLAGAASLTANAAQPVPRLSSDLDNESCAMCHDGSDSEIPAVTDDHLADSVHQGWECIDCHTDIVEIPHEDELQPAECVSCHDSEMAAYVSHGRGTVGVTPDLPTCTDCHGTHDVRAVDDHDSMVDPVNLATTCGPCHNDMLLAIEHEIRIKDAAARYEMSVHAQATREGKNAPTCTHCHGTDGTAHNIRPPLDATSSISHFNIPETCGQCHHAILEEYQGGIHGRLVAKGDTHSPVCTDCHGEHGILAIDDPRSNVNATHLAQDTCEPCHESARINEAYGNAAGEIISFVDSYHGLKNQSGDHLVANCASCHGAHGILPSTNPNSSIHPRNLQKTCGTCHPGITAEFASTPIHTPLESVSKWPGIVAKIYLWLIIAVIGGMLGFVVIDFIRGYKDVMSLKQVERMSKNGVVQHTLLMVSFIVLVYTGFALRYSEGWLFNKVFAWDGGFQVRGIIHRVSAVVFVIATAWHIVYLFTAEGRKFIKDMLPGLRDAREAKQATLYNLGAETSHPHYGRFTFAEKAEYWALVWGTIVMALTGIFLWFDALALQIFSKQVLDVLRVVHLYEAWLATLAILVWHMYGVMLKPGIYPGNPSWLTGKMPESMYIDEHAGEFEAPERKEAPAEKKRRELVDV